MMRKYLEDQLDAIDASVFSGDAFLDAENRKEFRRLMDRWEKELKLFDKMDAEIQLENMKGTRCQPFGSDQHDGDNGIE